MADDVLFIDNSKLFQEAFEAACKRALERCGMQAEGYAKEMTPVDTGNLRNSITHKVVENVAYIGTDVEYAIYIEMGTGKRILHSRSLLPFFPDVRSLS